MRIYTILFIPIISLLKGNLLGVPDFVGHKKYFIIFKMQFKWRKVFTRRREPKVFWPLPEGKRALTVKRRIGLPTPEAFLHV